ncbi:hypothetical protein ACFW1F_31890 [Streptomyces bungoensis]
MRALLPQENPDDIVVGQFRRLLTSRFVVRLGELRAHRMSFPL